MKVSLPIDIKSSPDVNVSQKSFDRFQAKGNDDGTDNEYESTIKSSEAQDGIREKKGKKNKEDSLHAHSSQTDKGGKTEEKNAEEISDETEMNAADDADSSADAADQELMTYVSLQEMLITLENEIKTEEMREESQVVQNEVQGAAVSAIALSNNSKNKSVESFEPTSTSVALNAQVSLDISDQSSRHEDAFDKPLDEEVAHLLESVSQTSEEDVEISKIDQPIKREESSLMNSVVSQAQLPLETEAVGPQVQDKKISAAGPSSLLTHITGPEAHHRGLNASKESSDVEAPRDVKPILTIDEVTLKAKIQENISIAVKEGRHQIQIRLDPPEMGRIFVKFDMGSKDIHIQMLAEHPQVKEVLDKSLLSLKHMLGEQGLNLGNVQVGVGGDQEWREKLARDEEAAVRDETSQVAALDKKAKFRARDMRASTIDHLV